MTRRYLACMPWKAASWWSGGLRPSAMSCRPMYHVRRLQTPGRPSRRCSLPISYQRIASTCVLVGAVVTTRASPTGCTSIHHTVATAEMNRSGERRVGEESECRKPARAEQRKQEKKAHLLGLLNTGSRQEQNSEE